MSISIRTGSCVPPGRGEPRWPSRDLGRRFPMPWGDVKRWPSVWNYGTSNTARISSANSSKRTLNTKPTFSLSFRSRWLWLKRFRRPSQERPQDEGGLNQDIDGIEARQKTEVKLHMVHDGMQGEFATFIAHGIPDVPEPR